MSSGRKTRSRMGDENIPNPGMTVAVSGISSLGAQTTLFSHYTSSSSSHVTLYYILTLHLILILACDIAMHCKLLKKCHCCTETLQIPRWPSRMQIYNYNLNVWLQNRFKRGMIWSFNLIASDKHRHCSKPHSHPHLFILMKRWCQVALQCDFPWVVTYNGSMMMVMMIMVVTKLMKMMMMMMWMVMMMMIRMMGL